MAKRVPSPGSADSAEASPKRPRVALADAFETDDNTGGIPVTLSEEVPAPVVAAAAGGSGNAPLEPMVVADMFTPVHRSWDAFEQSLKEYTQRTYQLYVVRTTTSVKRRNLRIAENALSSSSAAASSSSFLAPVVSVRTTSSLENDNDQETSGGADTADGSSRGASESGATGSVDTLLSSLPLHVHQQLIPESYKWYSKTLTCTHGWKDRHRGSGKRALAVARSTSCSAKMCVTLQHHGRGDDGWQVVLTRHVRTHNHPLSKELSLNYQENRRIYDPDLLLVPTGGGSGKLDDDAASHVRSPQLSRSRSRLSHLLVDQHHETAFAPLATDEPSDDVTGNPTHSGSTAVHGVFRAESVGQKAHASWDLFHTYVAEYAVQSKQSFRARSTVSVAAKNLKAKALAAKLSGCDDGRVDNDVLVPASERWYSKMLICSHGWKRKSRSKAVQARDDVVVASANAEATCPALLMARLQRTADGSGWHVVINRQVVEHNHPLGDSSHSHSHRASRNGTPVSSVFDSHRPDDTVAMAVSGSEPHHSVLHYFGSDDTGELSDSAGNELDADNDDADDDDDTEAPQPPPTTSSGSHPQSAYVVLAEPFETVHDSWDTFHARLQAYSDQSFQLYRVRTTSSVEGRNLKIPDVQLPAVRPARGRKSDGRVIPSEWKWYSKTLTCTHGWKERRRGTGKRTVQVFRSTACPVKLCATVQFVEAGDDEATDGSTASGKWCVVVTKHVLEHNHNLSKELHQHYCENRRIYDPDLLKIDRSSAHAVLKGKKPQHQQSLSLDPEDVSSALVPAVSNPRVVATASSQAESTPLLPASVLHTFALMGGESSLALSLAGPGAGHASEAASSTESVSTPATAPPGHPEASQTLSSYAAAAFPSTASVSNAMFPIANGTPQPPASYLYPAHQYFAVDHQTGSGLGFASPSFTSASLTLSTSGTFPSSAGGSSASTESPFGASSGVLGRCRVHSTESQGLRSDVSPNTAPCTCARSVDSTNASEVAASTHSRALVRLTPDTAAPLPSHAASDVSDHNVRVDVAVPQSASSSQDPAVDDDAAVVWTPTVDPEIVTLASSGGATFWRAPRVQRLHASWEAFQAHLDAYSVATFQLFRVRTTSSISARNARITQQGADRREVPTSVDEGAATAVADADAVSAVSLVPASFQWYSKTFVCTHGWKERRRGHGQRVSHSLRSTACPAKLCVTLQRVGQEAAQWHVVVTKQGTDHNHELSVAAYQQYSEVRRIKDPTLLDHAEALWVNGQTRRKVFEFLKQHAPNAIVMKDVHNLVQRWQQQRGGKPRGGGGRRSRAVRTADESSDAAKLTGDDDSAEELETTTTSSPLARSRDEKEDDDDEGI